jgi:predicted transglutaminase-like cysteine proteinase
MKKNVKMLIVPFVVVFTIGAGLMVPAGANDRPRDPFGGYTRELKEDDPAARIWDLLRDKMLIEKSYFQKCLESGDCPPIHALVQRLDEIRQYQGKALLGHLNIAVNFMITRAPSDWTTPLKAIATKNGDCKSYSITKYAVAQELGIPADHVRLVIVRSLRRNEQHMVVAVYQDGAWFILDNLTNMLVRDLESKDYEPLAVLDYKGVRGYLSALWEE